MEISVYRGGLAAGQAGEEENGGEGFEGDEEEGGADDAFGG
jgi:hypothetical protein